MTLPRLTLNQKLAAVALALGAIALFSEPHRGPFVKLDAQKSDRPDLGDAKVVVAGGRGMKNGES